MHARFRLDSRTLPQLPVPPMGYLAGYAHWTPHTFTVCSLFGVCYHCLADVEAPQHWLSAERQAAADHVVAIACDQLHRRGRMR